ncbi:MAG: ATP-binding protein [Saprospiraceae bacterium]|nr:ATP-binding protein [Saprospiraceae bacterium]
MLNLIYNAIKFTDSGGDVYLIAESISNNTIFELEVRDTGIGIPKEKIPLIFDRFYQANDLTQAFYEGSGIGLTLVKEYLKVLNGTIDVKVRSVQEPLLLFIYPFAKPQLGPTSRRHDIHLISCLMNRKLLSPLTKMLENQRPPYLMFWWWKTMSNWLDS